VPVKALARLARGKLKDAFARKRPDLNVPAPAWHRPRVVHATARGAGRQAVLEDRARDLFRVAVTNNRIVALDDGAVTTRYKKRKSNRLCTCRIAGGEFMRRFLAHVLPKGLHKVRYFGLWHPSRRALARRARLLLARERRAEPPPDPAPSPDLRAEPRAVEVEPQRPPLSLLPAGSPRPPPPPRALQPARTMTRPRAPSPSPAPSRAAPCACASLLLPGGPHDAANPATPAA